MKQPRKPLISSTQENIVTTWSTWYTYEHGLYGTRMNIVYMVHVCTRTSSRLLGAYPRSSGPKVYKCSPMAVSRCLTYRNALDAEPARLAHSLPRALVRGIRGASRGVVS
jgi:hypothetical protein